MPPGGMGRQSSTALCFMYNITKTQKLSFLVAERFQSTSGSFWLSCSRWLWLRTGSGFTASGVDGMEDNAAANGSTTSAGVLLKP